MPLKVSVLAVRAEGTQEVTKGEKDVVSLLRKAVADRVGQDRMQLWLRRDDALRVEGETVTVCAADDFTLERLRRNLRNDLLAAAQQVLGSTPQVVFRIDDAQKENRAATRSRTRAAPAVSPNQRLLSFADDDAASKSAETSDSPDVVPITPSVATATLAPASSVVRPVAAAPQGRRFARLESFVMGEGNRFAHAAALKAVNQPGQISPLYLHGPTGCGKTHLAEGIWSATRRQPNKHCVFLAAEQFTTMFLEGLHGQGLPSFRRKVREVDLLIIDDIQFLHGKRATLQELLNTVDYFARERKQLVLTADRAPADLPGLGAELVARLSCGLVADVAAPDAQVRRGVLGQQLAQRGRRLPEEVLELLARELPGDGRQLQGALNRLEAMHEATGRTLTVSFAREVLKDVLRTAQKMIRLADIDQAVCEVFGLPPKSLQTDAKARSITQPRMLAMWLARKHTRSGLTEISRHFGLKSHSTVVAAQKKVATWMQDQAPVGLGTGDCDVQEALRRVETVLRAI